MISANRWREPTSDRDVFQVLAENKVLAESHLARFQDMASFRNLLVHAYEKVDPEVVFGIFRTRLDDFLLFVHDINAWVCQTSSKR
ncbi:type VII toxin-antitoxin system HepT family RNase toxin [Desulfosoma sp.]